MTSAELEHVNLTVSDPDKLAEQLCSIFGWKIRWAGEARDNGRTVHVGTDSSYLALYTHVDAMIRTRSEKELLNLNHVAVLVDDLDHIERTVIAQKHTPINHADYEPGRRFYFQMQDELEIEVVSYRQ